MVFHQILKLTWWWCRITIGKRISRETFKTSTYRSMIYNATLRSSTARSWTRISTLLSDTRQVTGTFRVDSTFRSTIWWISDVIFQTRARRQPSNVSTLRVWPTWRWYTRIYYYWFYWLNWWC